MGIDLTIRKAELRDAADIVRFNLLLALETEGLRLEPNVVSAGVEALLQDSSKGIYFVAESREAVVGQLMITYEWSDWRNGMILWIQSVYVDQEQRGRGVFGRLFGHLRQLAVEHPGVCTIRLYMHEQNSQARRAYERLGLRQTHYQVFEMDLDAR